MSYCAWWRVKHFWSGLWHGMTLDLFCSMFLGWFVVGECIYFHLFYCISHSSKMLAGRLLHRCLCNMILSVEWKMQFVHTYKKIISEFLSFTAEVTKSCENDDPSHRRWYLWSHQCKENRVIGCTTHPWAGAALDRTAVWTCQHRWCHVSQKFTKDLQICVISTHYLCSSFMKIV